MNLWDLIEPPAWMADAACAGVDTETFYPDFKDPDAIRAAKRYCHACPVIERCLQYALAEPVDRAGIWGGMTPQEREQMARRAA